MGSFLENRHTQDYLKKCKFGDFRESKIKLIGKRGETKNHLTHFYCKNITDLIYKLDSYSSAKLVKK